MTKEQMKKVAPIIGYTRTIQHDIGEIKRLVCDLPQGLQNQIEYDMTFVDYYAGIIRRHVEEWVAK